MLMTVSSFAQSLDYISVRKKSGRVVKNFYSGSNILIETTNGRYVEGPLAAIRSDSFYITVYDIRLLPTIYGSYIKDTVSTVLVGLRKDGINRVQLTRKAGFMQRTGAPLLMLGGASYFALNILNGAFFNDSIMSARNLKTLGISAGAFGVGFLIRKLFSSDGFSKKSHQIVYVDL
jgi:hypothetical protein